MRYRRIVALVAVGLLLAGAQTTIRRMHPIAMGTWYPAGKEDLSASVKKLIAETDVPVPAGRCVALIVPHAPYSSFGDAAAAGFKLIRPGQYERVIILAPSHFREFRGCSIPSVQAYQTPLGDVFLDGPAVREICMSPLFELRSVRYRPNMERTDLHEREYAIEVILPFLQEQLGSFLLIPILVGNPKDYNNHTDENAITAIADKLRKFLDERTLLVVSTNFTHYGNTFSYRPFKDNILENIGLLDQQAFRLIIGRNYRGFQAYLDGTKNTICGQTALSVLLKLLPRQAEGTLLHYEVSARTSGDLNTSISYAAIAFTEPQPPAANPEPQSPTPKP